MGIQANLHNNFVDYSKPKFYKVPKTRTQYQADRGLNKLKKTLMSNVQVRKISIVRDKINKGVLMDLTDLDKLGVSVKTQYIN